MTYIILAAILIIVLILLTLLLSYITIDLHIKNQILYIKIFNLIFCKKIQVDLSKSKQTNKGNDASPKDNKTSFVEKIKKIKDRVFDADKGFNFDEIRKVKNEISETYAEIINIIKKLFGKLHYKIKVTTLRVELEYGTGNAATTGMLYGGIWQMLGVLYPIASSWVNMVYPSLDITPDFYGKRFNIEVWSIIKVKPAHIIYASFFALLTPAITYFKDKYKKGSEENGR